MFCHERLERKIGQEIAAVGEERGVPQQPLHILDPATCPQDLRLINELDRMSAIAPGGEQFLEQGGEMMRVDDERLHARGDEMIERESNERLLKDRDERLGQHFGEGPHPETEPGAENEGAGNHAMFRSALVLRRLSGKTGAMAEE